jgi:predicted ribosome quality control (RQC) complex YloA/Tae2 family protein
MLILMLIITKNNICYKLGYNAKENFNLIDEVIDINSNFWWFHLNSQPSGHCIVHNENLDEQIILFASNLVKYNSRV